MITRLASLFQSRSTISILSIVSPLQKPIDMELYRGTCFSTYSVQTQILGDQTTSISDSRAEYQDRVSRRISEWSLTQLTMEEGAASLLILALSSVKG